MSVKPLSRLTFLKRSAGATAVVGGAMAVGGVSSARASGDSPHTKRSVGKIVAVRSPRAAQVEVKDDHFEIQLGRSAIVTRGIDGSVADLAPFKSGELIAFAGPRDGSSVIATRVDLVHPAASRNANATRSA
jgi:hypothetical protein